MSDQIILLPVLVLVFLTFWVWTLMYYRRITEINKNKINLQSLADSQLSKGKLRNVSAADNFSNLLETPVLFYLICVLLYVLNSVTTGQLFLAWAFVILRIFHTMVHVTYNKVYHRWLLYVTSTVCLIIMWIFLALEIIKGLN